MTWDFVAASTACANIGAVSRVAIDRHLERCASVDCVSVSSIISSRRWLGSLPDDRLASALAPARASAAVVPARERATASNRACVRKRTRGRANPKLRASASRAGCCAFGSIGRGCAQRGRLRNERRVGFLCYVVVLGSSGMFQQVSTESSENILKLSGNLV